MQSKPVSSEWTVDLRGRITEKRVLGNGTLLIRIVTEQGEAMTVRGLPLERFNPLANNSQEMIFFSVTPDTVRGYFVGNPMTTVYSVVRK